MVQSSPCNKDIAAYYITQTPTLNRHEELELHNSLLDILAAGNPDPMELHNSLLDILAAGNPDPMELHNSLLDILAAANPDPMVQ
jgi:hypothetical protein